MSVDLLLKIAGLGILVVGSFLTLCAKCLILEAFYLRLNTHVALDDRAEVIEYVHKLEVIVYVESSGHMNAEHLKHIAHRTVYRNGASVYVTLS